jgi:hypothetical protein
MSTAEQPNFGRVLLARAGAIAAQHVARDQKKANKARLIA